MADAIYILYITILEVRQLVFARNVASYMPKYPARTGAAGRKAGSPACEPDRSRHLPDVRTYSRSLRTDVGLLSLNKIPSKSVKNEQKALANPANRITNGEISYSETVAIPIFL